MRRACEGVAHVGVGELFMRGRGRERREVVQSVMVQGQGCGRGQAAADSGVETVPSLPVEA